MIEQTRHKHIAKQNDAYNKSRCSHIVITTDTPQADYKTKQ